MVIIKKIREIKEYDVKKTYGQDAEGVTIRWISEKRTGGQEYLHHFALRYFIIKPGGYIAPHQHPWEQEIVITKGHLQITGSKDNRFIEKDDIAYFAGNEEHGFKNIGNKPSEFYCIIGCLGNGENCIGISET
jgi:quercetin dioxygenase-like cupin family protein